MGTFKRRASCFNHCWRFRKSCRNQIATSNCRNWKITHTSGKKKWRHQNPNLILIDIMYTFLTYLYPWRDFYRDFLFLRVHPLVVTHMWPLLQMNSIYQMVTRNKWWIRLNLSPGVIHPTFHMVHTSKVRLKDIIVILIFSKPQLKNSVLLFQLSKTEFCWNDCGTLKRPSKLAELKWRPHSYNN